MNNKLNNLPLAHTIETQKVLKKAISANRVLANFPSFPCFAWEQVEAKTGVKNG